MSRIVNLPEGGSVRFCLDDGRCITAELREDAPPAAAPVVEPQEAVPQVGEAAPHAEVAAVTAHAGAAPDEIVHAEDPSLWSAWIKIPARALAGSDIRVEVLSAEGTLLASKVMERSRGDGTAR